MCIRDRHGWLRLEREPSGWRPQARAERGAHGRMGARDAGTCVPRDPALESRARTRGRSPGRRRGVDARPVASRPSTPDSSSAQSESPEEDDEDDDVQYDEEGGVTMLSSTARGAAASAQEQ